MRTVYVAWNRHGPWAVADTEQGAWDAVAERIAAYATGWPQSPNSPEWWQRRASEGILVDPVEVAA